MTPYNSDPCIDELQELSQNYRFASKSQQTDRVVLRNPDRWLRNEQQKNMKGVILKHNYPVANVHEDIWINFENPNVLDTH